MATMIGSMRQLTPPRRTVAGRRTRVFGGPRPRRRDRSGVDEPQRWWPGPLIVSLAIVTGFAVVVFLAWLGWSIYVVVHGSPSNFGQFDPDRRCGPLGFSCGAITNILTSVLLIALASFSSCGGYSGWCGSTAAGPGLTPASWFRPRGPSSMTSSAAMSCARW